MKLENLHFIGWLAASLTSVGFIPQIIKALKTKSTKDISWGLLFITLSGILLWLSYGVIIKNTIIISANTFTSLTLIILIFIKIAYGKNNGS